MGTEHNLKDKINLHFEKLPKNQKRIAEFYLENLDEASFLNVQDVAKATSTNVATIVRFSQRLGFAGYSEMKNQIIKSFRKNLQSKNAFPLVDSAGNEENSLTSVANLEITNINETLNLNENSDFNGATDLIVSSERVFTVGLGISHLLVQILAYQLNQVGKFSYAFNNSSSTFMEQLLLSNKNDLIIALSFPPYSTATIEAAKFAKKRGTKVISITNKKSAPITIHSDYSLIVKSENMLFTNSFAAISVLINAMVTEVAVKDKANAVKMIKAINKVTKDQKITTE